MLVSSWSLSLCWISTIHTWCESRWIDVPLRYRPKRPPPSLPRWAKGLLQKRAHREVFSVLKGLLYPLDSRGALLYVSSPLDVSFITDTQNAFLLLFSPFLTAWIKNFSLAQFGWCFSSSWRENELINSYYPTTQVLADQKHTPISSASDAAVFLCLCWLYTFIDLPSGAVVSKRTHQLAQRLMTWLKHWNVSVMDVQNILITH